MRKWLTMFGICAGVAAVLGLYRFEIHVRLLEQDLAALNKQILKSQQEIQVLEAEWAFLTQPARLQALSRKHLNLVPILPSQIGPLANLPEKTPDRVDYTDSPAAKPLTLTKAEKR